MVVGVREATGADDDNSKKKTGSTFYMLTLGVHLKSCYDVWRRRSKYNADLPHIASDCLRYPRMLASDDVPEQAPTT